MVNRIMLLCVRAVSFQSGDKTRLSHLRGPEMRLHGVIGPCFKHALLSWIKLKLLLVNLLAI
jgi:hypothetical protein